MLGPTVGNDILDIGSRKAAMARQAASAAADPLCLGRPGQFEVPNVADVRMYCACFLRIDFRSFSIEILGGCCCSYCLCCRQFSQKM